MWTRAELKAKGKAAFKANYWKSVFTAAILAVVLGGGLVSGGRSAASSIDNSDDVTTTETIHVDGNTIDINGYTVNVDGDIVTIDGKRLEGEGEDLYLDGELVTVDDDGVVTVGDETYVFDDEVVINNEPVDTDELAVVVPIVLALLGGVFLIAMVVGFALDAFLLNPLEMGCRRFFMLNLNQQASINSIGFAFDHNYINTVKTLFIRDLKIVGWSLLFVIPGIVKGYEYQMIPYLLAEDPTMSTRDAFAKSREMMTGNKWNAFVLDLSFIGWEFLSVITLGLVGLFYANPYMEQTRAALYETLRYGSGAPTYGNQPAQDMGAYNI